MNEQKEVKLKKQLFSYVKDKINFVGTPIQIDEKRRMLVEDLFDIFEGRPQQIRDGQNIS